jgi:crotonobetainyl-CoA:carnitine CoA-transferase CaiB-like acyl-CoA transferase
MASDKRQPPPQPSPLAGLRVLEFSHTIMGPCAGLLLADLGADVLKVEPAPGGDATRKLNGFAAGFFATFNRNKQSIAINLKTEEGRQIVHRLVADADIVLDNYGPGTMEKLGCGSDELMALNERLIFLSLKGYLAGPWQDRPALDEVVQFQSGLAYMTGPEGQPLRAGASVIDILGAVFGVSGVLAAVHERTQTGKGQRVGSSLFESAAFLMASHVMGGAVTGQTVPPMTARKGAWGIYDVFDTRDNQQVFVGVTSDSQWNRFCQQFSFGDLQNDERLATNPMRTSEREWLIPLLRKALIQLTADELMDGCTIADISWSPVGRPEDLLENEQLLANGGLLATALASVPNAATDAIRASQVMLPGLPLEFGDEKLRSSVATQPPECGEHTERVLKGAGYSVAEIASFMERNVISGC